MLNMGSGRVPGVVPGIAPPGTHPLPHPGYTPLLDYWHVHCCTGMSADPNMVVGLKSVYQLTLDALFSRFRGITEGYNLLTVGRINNH